MGSGVDGSNLDASCDYAWARGDKIEFVWPIYEEGTVFPNYLTGGIVYLGRHLGTAHPYHTLIIQIYTYSIVICGRITPRPKNSLTTPNRSLDR